MRNAFALAAVVLAGSIAAATAAGTAKPLPTLEVFGLAPLQVRGAHFFGQEKVNLTLRAGKTALTRTAVASKAGGFVVSFGTLSTTARCSGSISVAARGARKDAATYKLPSLACPTAPSPASQGLSVTYSG